MNTIIQLLSLALWSYIMFKFGKSIGEDKGWFKGYDEGRRSAEAYLKELEESK